MVNSAANATPPRTSPPWREVESPQEYRRSVGIVVAVLGLLAAASALVLFFFDPRVYHFYPFCFFHKTTGLLCPGCGALRAAHQLLHGHVATAFQFNPMLVIALPLLALWMLYYALQKLRNRPRTSLVRPAWLWILLIVALAVSALRNLPGTPFSLLRP